MVTCTVSGESSWNSGYVAQITVKNNGAAPVNAWAVTVNVGDADSLVAGWNANINKTGNKISASNYSYNGALQPGQSTTFGFQGGHDGNHQTPTCD